MYGCWPRPRGCASLPPAPARGAAAGANRTACQNWGGRDGEGARLVGWLGAEPCLAQPRWTVWCYTPTHTYTQHACPPARTRSNTHLADDGGIGVQVGQVRQRVVPGQRAQPVKELSRAVRQPSLGQLLQESSDGAGVQAGEPLSHCLHHWLPGLETLRQWGGGGGGGRMVRGCRWKQPWLNVTASCRAPRACGRTCMPPNCSARARTATHASSVSPALRAQGSLRSRLRQGRRWQRGAGLPCVRW